MPGQTTDPTGVKILDAASRGLADVGFKRVTVELVAKYAAVSHMTVYRRWSSKADLLRFALLRELSMILDAAFANAADVESCDEKVVQAFGNTVWAVRNHPLMIKELDTDSEVLLATMSTGSGWVMHTAVPLVTEQLGKIVDAQTSADDVDALADVFVRMAHSVIVVQRADNPLETRADLDVYARRFFDPLPARSQVASVHLHAGGRAPLSAAADVAPGPRMQRHSLQLAAASLVAVLLVGAGVSAVWVRQSGPPLSPDLVKTEQPSAPMVSAIVPAPSAPVVTVPAPTVAAVPSAGDVPAVLPIRPEEPRPSTSVSAAPTFSRSPTTNRAPSGGGSDAPIAGDPQRPPRPSYGRPPPGSAPGQPPMGSDPGATGPRTGAGGPNHGGQSP